MHNIITAINAAIPAIIHVVGFVSVAIPKAIIASITPHNAVASFTKPIITAIEPNPIKKADKNSNKSLLSFIEFPISSIQSASLLRNFVILSPTHSATGFKNTLYSIPNCSPTSLTIGSIALRQLVSTFKKFGNKSSIVHLERGTKTFS